MTLSEVYKVENSIVFAYASAKSDYEINLKDYAEDDFVTLMSKQDMKRLEEAKQIIEKERKEITAKYTQEQINRVLDEVMI